MANFALCAALFACLVALSEQQIIPRPLEAYRASSDVERMVTSAHNLTSGIYLLISDVYRTHEDSQTKNSSLIVATLNETVKPIEDAIKEVLLHPSNRLARNCIARAQTTIRQLVISGSRVAYDCTLKIREQLYNFTTTVAALEIGESSTLGKEAFTTALKCPSSFLVETISDLNNAKPCYIDAVNKVTNYVNQTIKQLNELQTALNILKTNISDCVSSQSDFVLEETRSAVARVVDCRVRTNVLVLPAKVLAAFKAGIERIINDMNNYDTNFIASAERQIKHNTNEISTQKYSENIIYNEQMNTARQIDLYGKYVTEFELSANWTSRESQCVDDANLEFYDHDFDAAWRCINEVESNLAELYAKLPGAVTELKEGLAKKFVEMQFKCTNLQKPTEESITKCIEDTKQSFLRSTDSTNILENILTSSASIVQKSHSCVESEMNDKNQRRSAVLTKLDTCMEEWSKNNS